MSEHLNKLYHPLILTHNKNPVSFEKKEGAQYVFEANNPMCGDRFKLYFDIDNGQLSNLSFFGFGCAVSKASTSVLVKSLDNQSKDQSLQIVRDFLSMFSMEGAQTDVQLNDDFLPFQAAKDFPGRIKCATLAWKELNEFLEQL